MNLAAASCGGISGTNVEKSGTSLIDGDFCPDHTTDLCRMMENNHRSKLPQSVGLVGWYMKFHEEQSQFGGGPPMECNRFSAIGVHSQFVCLDPAWKYNQDQGVSVWNELCFHSPLDQLNQPWNPVSILQWCMGVEKSQIWPRTRTECARRFAN